MREHTRMLLGLVVGAGLGLVAKALAGDAPWLAWTLANVTGPIGQAFLRLLFMLVVPMIFSALVMGVADLELRHLGRLGARALGYTVVISTIAVLIGLGLVNLFRPGEGMSDEVRALARSSVVPKAAAAPSDTAPAALLVSIIPDNPVKAAANGDYLGLIFFALVFGIALGLTRTPAAERLKEVIAGLYEVTLVLIRGVLKVAPLGVAALLFGLTARLGFDVLRQLAAYVGVVLLGLALHMFVVYSLSVRFFGGRNPVQFFRDVRMAAITAFSTASSNATLPTALKVAEEELKLPPNVARFVLTAGASMNQNGTALFEGVTVLFIAQLFGVHLSLQQQLVVMFICVLGGVGTAGVPAGSLPVIAMILGMFRIPPEGLGLILGVDRLLDMCRTTLNVVGDLAAAVYVARGEPVGETPAASTS
ncbi:MAG TPA: dicarboxylate/amino acid:cation symporter [Myxococcaceae bacterium]|nr:dicarboxylate/amino acid:cation symporter [Myxococcaceae bacterium]